MQLRAYAPSDAEPVLALNQAALEGVGTLDRDRLDWLAGLADRVEVADDAGTVAGFAVLLRPGTAYDSRNYAWFAQRYADFGYLDRVVVAPTHRRRGVGTLLYDRMEEHVSGAGRMALEVYAEPPNVASLAFHAGRGYVEVGRVAQPGGRTAAMLVLDLPPGAENP